MKTKLDRWLLFEDGSRLWFEVRSGPNEHGDLVITIHAMHTGGLSQLAAWSLKL